MNNIIKALNNAKKKSNCIVLLRGYAAKNLGDDLFFDIALKRYKNTTFILETNEVYHNSSINKNNNLIIIPNLMPKKTIIKKAIDQMCLRLFPQIYSYIFYKQLKKRYAFVFDKIDIFLNLGGSIFIQPPYKMKTYPDLEYHNFLIENYPNKDKYFLGCNFGPYNQKKYLNGYKSIFEYSKDVCFRDLYSYELFDKLKNVRLHPDIVFSYDISKYKVTNQNGYGLCLINPKNRTNIKYKDYIDYYSGYIEYLLNLGENVKLFTFCKKEGDEEVANDIFASLKNKSNIEVINYTGDIDGFLQQYSSVEYMICGRFHSIVLSMLFDQSILPLSYSDKMINVLKDLNYGGDILDLKTIPLDNYERVSYKYFNGYEIGSAKKQCLKHFSNLDKKLI